MERTKHAHDRYMERLSIPKKYIEHDIIENVTHLFTLLDKNNHLIFGKYANYIVTPSLRIVTIMKKGQIMVSKFTYIPATKKEKSLFLNTLKTQGYSTE